MSTDILCPICEEELLPPLPGKPHYRCPDGCGKFTLTDITIQNRERDRDTGALEMYTTEGEREEE